MPLDGDARPLVRLLLPLLVRRHNCECQHRHRIAVALDARIVRRLMPRSVHHVRRVAVHDKQLARLCVAHYRRKVQRGAALLITRVHKRLKVNDAVQLHVSTAAPP